LAAGVEQVPRHRGDRGDVCLHERAQRSLGLGQLPRHQRERVERAADPAERRTGDGPRGLVPARVATGKGRACGIHRCSGLVGRLHPRPRVFPMLFDGSDDGAGGTCASPGMSPEPPARGRAIDLAAETMGELVSFWGFKSSLGRIWTLLYLTPEPLSADVI